MVSLSLPISKSIANRKLLLQSMHGDPLMGVSDAYIPDDVRLLHDALQTIADTPSAAPLTLHLANCGTAMRFLTAYCAQKEGTDIILEGDERMSERPIGQEVEALQRLGADIEYTGTVGFPPLHIRGKRLNGNRLPFIGKTADTYLDSTQFVSALLLIGINIDTCEESPYIGMTRQMIRSYPDHGPIERDWSAAAFWYEYVALHGGEIFLQDLRPSSLQGDQCVADIFSRLGVQTRYLTDPQQTGVVLTKDSSLSCTGRQTYSVNFADCPDLYPAVAITCEQSGIQLNAQGTERLPLKESNRLKAIKEHTTYHDHRVAMALLAADLPCDDTDCISKSYPDFLSQLRQVQDSQTPSH